MHFAFFPLHLSKVLRLPRRSDARSYEVLHLSRKIIFPKLKIWCSKMQPLSGNQRPDLLISLMSMSLVLRLPRKMHPDPLQMSHACHCFSKFFEILWSLHVLLTFDTVHNPLRLPRETTSERPKVVRMCFAPQRRALFRHLNFQKCSQPGVLCAFWLRNVLGATTACKFFISHLARWLCTRRFSEPTFRPSGATNHWKTPWAAAFLPFRAPASSFLWLFLFSDLLLFSSLTLPTSAFPSVHIVESLTSKLPSDIL